MEDNSQIIKEDEIDLIELVKVIWSKRWFIGKVTSVFMALGLLIAFTSPKEYETSCILIPEAMDGGGGSLGSLGGLASLAGIDVGGLSGGSSSTINPGLYRSVAQSTPFLLTLMSQKFYFAGLEKETTLYDYYMKHYKVGLIQQILYFPLRAVKWILPGSEEAQVGENKGHGIVSLTKDQQMCAADLKERILVTMDWELNVVTIEVEMQDPLVAAEVGNFTQKYITEYVTNYAISKSHEQLKFAQAQFESRKQEFEDIQLELAQFRDQNQYVNTSQAKSGEERLQSRYNLSYNIYNQLAQQVETIKLQINESTPVFTVLEPVKVPVEKSKPLRFIIILIFTFIGGALSVGGVLTGYAFANRT
ncbi:MAG: Wzz/FepE/Etk N-terminal domain-containing protein [Cyclobacteriaceae bacterium]